MHGNIITLWVGVPVALVCIAVFVLVRVRTKPHSSAISAVDRWVVAIIGAGAALVALVAAWALTSTAFSAFSGTHTVIRNLRLGNASVPSFTEKSALITGAGYESVWLEVENPPLETRWLLFLEAAVPTLTVLVIATAVAWLALALLRGRPFARSLPVFIGATAIVVLVGNLATQIVAGAARASVIEYLDPRTITAGDMGDGPYEGLGMVLNLDLSPVGWAFGLALVALAFHVGTRLQRDTEGLV